MTANTACSVQEFTSSNTSSFQSFESILVNAPVHYGSPVRQLPQGVSQVNRTTSNALSASRPTHPNSFVEESSCFVVVPQNGSCMFIPLPCNCGITSAAMSYTTAAFGADPDLREPAVWFESELINRSGVKQFRASRSTRSGRPGGQSEQDIFDGLPIRQWRFQETAVSANEEPGQTPDVAIRGSGMWKEMPMPKGSEHYSPWSLQILREARLGRIIVSAQNYSRGGAGRIARDEDKENELENGVDGAGDDKRGKASAQGFMAKRWLQIPKHLEEPEVEHLAKKRRGLSSMHAKIEGAVAPAVGSGTLRKTRVRRVDDQGRTNMWEVLVPEGHPIEGEVDEPGMAENLGISISRPAPGTVIGGLGVANDDGVIVASITNIPAVSVVSTPVRPRGPRKKIRGGFRKGRGKKLGYGESGGVSASAEALYATNDIAMGEAENSAAGNASEVNPAPEKDGGEEDETDAEADEDDAEEEDGEAEPDEDEGDGDEDMDRDDDDEDREEGEVTPTPEPPAVVGPTSKVAPPLSIKPPTEDAPTLIQPVLHPAAESVAVEAVQVKERISTLPEQPSATTSAVHDLLDHVEAMREAKIPPSTQVLSTTAPVIKIVETEPLHDEDVVMTDAVIEEQPLKELSTQQTLPDIEEPTTEPPQFSEQAVEATELIESANNQTQLKKPPSEALHDDIEPPTLNNTPAPEQAADKPMTIEDPAPQTTSIESMLLDEPPLASLPAVAMEEDVAPAIEVPTAVTAIADLLLPTPTQIPAAGPIPEPHAEAVNAPQLSSDLATAPAISTSYAKIIDIAPSETESTVETAPGIPRLQALPLEEEAKEKGKEGLVEADTAPADVVLGKDADPVGVEMAEVDVPGEIEADSTTLGSADAELSGTGDGNVNVDIGIPLAEAETASLEKGLQEE